LHHEEGAALHAQQINHGQSEIWLAAEIWLAPDGNELTPRRRQQRETREDRWEPKDDGHRRQVAANVLASLRRKTGFYEKVINVKADVGVRQYVHRDP
jgi:hypothetical protein